jgi:protein gp37
MSKIEWTNKTWNPFVGCTKVSSGCKNCYAINMAYRLAAIASKSEADGKNAGRARYYKELTKKSGNLINWTGQVVFVPEALEMPLGETKPTSFFVNSMSDLFHNSLSHDQIDQVFDVIQKCPQHKFQILTKRPNNLVDYMMNHRRETFENVWLGVSVEDSSVVDRIQVLANTPAQYRWLSCEPLLEETYLQLDQPAHIGNNAPAIGQQIHGIVIGGESGPKCRKCDINWIVDIIEQAQEFNIPVFVKQLGGNAWHGDIKLSKKIYGNKGQNYEVFPEVIKKREFFI